MHRQCALADGAVCIGGKTVSEGVLLIINYTSTVPHNITLFVEHEVTIVLESNCSCLIDLVLPVVVIP